MAVIAIAAVAVVAVAAFAVAPRLGINPGGYPEAIDLAQMSGEESGRFLSGLSEYEYVDENLHWCVYATSDELAEAMEEYYETAIGTIYDGIDVNVMRVKARETFEAYRETGGSTYVAYDKSSYHVNAQAVSNWDDIGGFDRTRAVDEMPGAEELEDTVRGLGGEHMVVWKWSEDGWREKHLEAAYTAGDGILRTLSYTYDGSVDVTMRSDGAFYSQDDVSRLQEAIRVAGSQGADGLRSSLDSSSSSTHFINIPSDADIIYYE